MDRVGNREHPFHFRMRADREREREKERETKKETKRKTERKTESETESYNNNRSSSSLLGATLLRCNSHL